MTDSLQCGAHILNLSITQVMGILNTTPDSFSDGGHFNSLDRALNQADQMLQAGASIIDVGGESTRPGAKDVSVDEEMNRVIPVIEGIRSRLDIAISIDTSKCAVMAEAIKAGAGMINDVNALQVDGALDIAARSSAVVCLMHMQGKPRTMQQSPQYGDCVAEVGNFLQERIEAAEIAGIKREKIIIDPGFGFGKSLEHNLLLLKGLPELQERLQRPLLVGISRKSMLGHILNREVDDRLYGSLAAAALASWMGVAIVRVHDVLETMDIVKVVNAVREC